MTSMMTKKEIALERRIKKVSSKIKELENKKKKMDRMRKFPELMTLGITNETEDNYFVPFADYDEIDYRKVFKDIQHIAKIFKLTCLIVLSTKEEDYSDESDKNKIIGNYHVIGLDKLTYQEHSLLMRHIRCDPLYKKISHRYSQRNWVLRIGPKVNMRTGKRIKDFPFMRKVFIFPKNMRKRNLKYQQSNAHYRYFKKMFNINIQLPNSDKLKELELIEYNTR